MLKIPKFSNLQTAKTRNFKGFYYFSCDSVWPLQGHKQTNKSRINSGFYFSVGNEIGNYLFFNYNFWPVYELVNSSGFTLNSSKISFIDSKNMLTIQLVSASLRFPILRFIRVRNVWLICHNANAISALFVSRIISSLPSGVLSSQLKCTFMVFNLSVKRVPGNRTFRNSFFVNPKINNTKSNMCSQALTSHPLCLCFERTD